MSSLHIKSLSSAFESCDTRDKLHSLRNGLPITDSSNAEFLLNSWYDLFLTQKKSAKSYHGDETVWVKELPGKTWFFCSWSEGAQVLETPAFFFPLLLSQCFVCNLVAQTCFLTSTDIIHPCRLHFQWFTTQRGYQ